MRNLLFLLLSVLLITCKKTEIKTITVTPQLSTNQNASTGKYYWYVSANLSQATPNYETKVTVEWEVLNAAKAKINTHTYVVLIAGGTLSQTYYTMIEAPTGSSAGISKVTKVESSAPNVKFEYRTNSGNAIIGNTGSGSGSGTGSGSSGCGTYNGKALYKGPDGGCYYINSSGNKTYVDRSYCKC